MNVLLTRQLKGTTESTTGKLPLDLSKNKGKLYTRPILLLVGYIQESVTPNLTL